MFVCRIAPAQGASALQHTNTAPHHNAPGTGAHDATGLSRFLLEARNRASPSAQYPLRPAPALRAPPPWHAIALREGGSRPDDIGYAHAAPAFRRPSDPLRADCDGLYATDADRPPPSLISTWTRRAATATRKLVAARPGVAP